MNECMTYIPTTNPDKLLGSGMPTTSANQKIYLTWLIPTSFITVDPEITFCWVSLNKTPVKVDWVFKYQYLNKETCMGYFDESGIPKITFDDGHSEPQEVTLNSEGLAEPDIIQATPPLHLIKKDRRSGAFVAMEIEAQPQLDEVYFMGANIKYEESPRVIEPIGRKRPHKRSRWDDDYDYYRSFR